MLGCVVAIPLGFFLGLNKTAYQIASPLLSLLLPLPAVAWTPIFLVAFGQGDVTIIAVCFLGAFFPILYSTIQGVRGIGRHSLWVVRSMGASRLDIFRRVLLPGALPTLIAGLKLGMAHSWRTLVAAEMLAALTHGLGFMIFAARSYMDVTTMFVGIVCLAIIGLLIERVVFGSLEALTVRRWHGSGKIGSSGMSVEIADIRLERHDLPLRSSTIAVSIGRVARHCRPAIGLGDLCAPRLDQRFSVSGAIADPA